MENEQEQIKINNYDINMLIGIYFYDQGTIQLSKLAERLCAPDLGRIPGVSGVQGFLCRNECLL